MIKKKKAVTTAVLAGFALTALQGTALAAGSFAPSHTALTTTASTPVSHVLTDRDDDHDDD